MNVKRHIMLLKTILFGVFDVKLIVTDPPAGLLASTCLNSNILI